MRRYVAVSKLAAKPLTGRMAGLVSEASVTSKKPIDQFFKNFQITGAAPQGVLKGTTKETSINNAWRFLSKSMLIPVKESKYPNKLNWPKAAANLNQYTLTNAQKNLIRRVNIAIAAQPVKGYWEIRRHVKIPLTGNRNANIAAQVAAVKKAKENENRAQRQQNGETRTPRSRQNTTPKPAWKPVTTYGVW